MPKHPKARKPATVVKTSKGEVVIPRAPGVVGEVPKKQRFKIADRVRKMADDVFKNCYLISITFKRPGAHKKVKDKESVIREGHNLELLDVGKRIMAWPEYTAIAQFESACRDHTERCCQPMPTGVNFFKQGTYIISKGNVNRAYRYLEGRRAEYEQLVANLKANYTQRMREDARVLDTDFNPKDYIKIESIDEAFGFDFFLDRFEPFRSHGDEGIDPDIIEVEDAKGRERIQNCILAMETGLAEAISSVAVYLLERLADEQTPGGKRRHIRAKAIDNKLEIVRSFRDLDLTGNPVLGKNIATLEEIFSGVTVNGLRHDTEMRDQIRAKAEEVKASLEKFIVEDAGTRKFTNVFAAKQKSAKAA